MRVFIFFLIIIFDISIRTTILQHFSFFSVLPNTTLILIISYGMLRNQEEGCLFGFITGLIFDLLIGNYIGLFTFTGLIVGYFSSVPFTSLYRESFLPPTITVLVSSFFYELIFYILNIYTYEYISFFGYLYAKIMPTVLYSIAVTPIIFKIISNINIYIEKKESYKRKVF